jgi:hypothetical protein
MPVLRYDLLLFRRGVSCCTIIGLAENFFQALDLGHPVQAELLKISSQRVYQATLVAIELLNPLGFCLAFELFWMM